MQALDMHWLRPDYLYLLLAVLPALAALLYVSYKQRLAARREWGEEKLIERFTRPFSKTRSHPGTHPGARRSHPGTHPGARHRPATGCQLRPDPRRPGKSASHNKGNVYSRPSFGPMFSRVW